MMETIYYSLATKLNFNKGLRHFFKVNEVVEEMESERNLADIINDQLDEEEMSSDQILPIVGSLIRNKYAYSFHSFNIPQTVIDFKKITDVTSKWTAIDIVMVYYNPNSEILVVNPKSQNHWERVRELSKDQLIVIYTKYITSENGENLEREAIVAIEELISGKDVFINKKFINQKIVPKRVVDKSTPKPGMRGRSPKYSVQVTNEVFHNGNVEAWKKIVESFKNSYPDLDVAIYYEDELINNINSLFAWGKVNNGAVIFFQIIGENIRDIFKLQKYLSEGASPRFAQFLKLEVGKVLKLF